MSAIHPQQSQKHPQLQQNKHQHQHQHHYQHQRQDQHHLHHPHLGGTPTPVHPSLFLNTSSTSQPQSYTLYPDPPLKQPPSPTSAALHPFATTPSPSQLSNNPKRHRQLPLRSYSDVTPHSSSSYHPTAPLSSTSSSSPSTSSITSFPASSQYQRLMSPATRSMSAGTLVSQSPAPLSSPSSHYVSSKDKEQLGRPRNQNFNSASTPSLASSMASSASDISKGYVNITLEDRQPQSHDRVYNQRPSAGQSTVTSEERYGGPVRHTGPSRQKSQQSQVRQEGGLWPAPVQVSQQKIPGAGSISAPSTPTRQRQDSVPKLPPLSFEKEALHYQMKLKQKPPRQDRDFNDNGDDDDDDDSDTGSIISYRRSIHRLSMTYKRTNGIPNISLFAPNQRPGATKERDMDLHPSNAKVSANSYSGGQRIANGNKSTGTLQPALRLDGRMIPDRAGSLDSITQKSAPPQHQKTPPSPSLSVEQTYPQNTSMQTSTRSRSNTTGPTMAPHQHHQHNHLHHQQSGPSPASTAHISNRNLANAAAASVPNSSSTNNSPRPSHESAQSQRSNYGRSRADPFAMPSSEVRHGRSVTTGHANSESRSKSLGRQPVSASGGNGSYSQVPSRSGGSGGGLGASRIPPVPSSPRTGGLNFNQHPAHHLTSGGYVRPEEAVGPSNPTPEKAEDYVRQGIDFHEIGEIKKATQYFRSAAEMGDPVGMLMFGLSVRHGWGCTANRPLAFQYLQKSAEHAVGDLKSRDSFASTAAKGELVLAIYELGICFRHGWGVEKSKKTAAYYFDIAANLGDPDAQNDLAWCYYHGVGVKKDMFKSAKYYRLAAAQGLTLMGNSWIWKDKYGGVPPSPSPKSPKSPATSGISSLSEKSLRSPF